MDDHLLQILNWACHLRDLGESAVWMDQWRVKSSAFSIKNLLLSLLVLEEVSFLFERQLLYQNFAKRLSFSHKVLSFWKLSASNLRNLWRIRSILNQVLWSSFFIWVHWSNLSKINEGLVFKLNFQLLSDD